MSLPYRPNPADGPEVDPATAAAALEAGTAVVVDVREPDEWAEGRIPGAFHIPLGELPGRLAELPANRDLLLVCRSGGRSDAATEFLRHHGFAQAANLEGGMIAWQEGRHPIER